MPGPRDQAILQNQATFRGTITPEFYQQMGQYGLGRGEWPDWRQLSAGLTKDELPLLEALIMGFKKEQDARLGGGIQEKGITLQPGDEDIVDRGNAGPGYVKRP